MCLDNKYASKYKNVMGLHGASLIGLSVPLVTHWWTSKQDEVKKIIVCDICQCIVILTYDY